MANILFVCTGNACRSPMAEGLARRLGLQAESAGVLAAGVHPRAVQALAELDVDISGHRSRTVPDVADEYDVVITLCDYARSVYPRTPRARRARWHWPVEDPITAVGTDLEVRHAFRAARDEIDRRLRAALAELQAM